MESGYFNNGNFREYSYFAGAGEFCRLETRIPGGPRTSAGAECRTSCVGVLDKRGLTFSGSSRQGRDSLHCSMYCSLEWSTGPVPKVPAPNKSHGQVCRRLLDGPYASSAMTLFMFSMDDIDANCKHLHLE